MTKKLWLWVGALALLVLALGCERVVPTTNPIEIGQRVVVPEFEWRVLSQEVLDKQCGQHVYGCVGTNLVTGRKVVYTLPPRYVDDSPTRTLGHEVMHLVYGDYHDRPK